MAGKPRAAQPPTGPVVKLPHYRGSVHRARPVITSQVFGCGTGANTKVHSGNANFVHFLYCHQLGPNICKHKDNDQLVGRSFLKSGLVNYLSGSSSRRAAHSRRVIFRSHSSPTLSLISKNTNSQPGPVTNRLPRITCQRVIREYGSAVRVESRVSTDERHSKMIACVKEYRVLKQTGSRLFCSSHAQDVKSTSNKLHQELKNLTARRDTSSLCVTVCTDAEHNNVPEYYIDTISRDFIEIYLAMSVHDFYTKYESYMLLGLSGVTVNNNNRRTLLKKTIRSMVCSALCQLTDIAKARMSWLNYKICVVQKYSVVLEGWPTSTMELGGMSLAVLQSIIDGIHDGSCSWKKLTAEELQARITTLKASRNEPTITCKKRSDAGVKCKAVASDSDSKMVEENDSD
ncbi:hypothetical protein DFH11DRAFT_1546008 [Phellopilus nigrolimitatus]|nr:hypothetical protein DFH11DRAFT_1546008 [Phellopilus nigrolimitatus]